MLVDVTLINIYNRARTKLTGKGLVTFGGEIERGNRSECISAAA